MTKSVVLVVVVVVVVVVDVVVVEVVVVEVVVVVVELEKKGGGLSKSQGTIRTRLGMGKELSE